MAAAIAALAGELGSRVALAHRMAGAEAFRLQHPHVYDARNVMEGATDDLWLRRWDEYKKSSRAVVTVGGQSYTVETNSFGYRTHEFARTKPAGTLRILCIGGSTTVQGESNDTTYPAILERRLRERHPELSIEVLNLGISGVQSDYWSRKGYSFLAFEPDVVVQYEGVNDLVRQVSRWAGMHPWSAAPYRSVLFASLFRLPYRQLDEEIATTLENLAGMSEGLARVGAIHVVGTFAAPDASQAAADVRGYLAYNLLHQWSPKRLPLYSYASYYGLLQHFNARLVASAGAGYRIAPVAARLQAPDRFVDVCHMTQAGIADLAAAFLPEVEQAVLERSR